MTLSTLIRKGGLAQVATATPATLATQETASAATVAQVATVAVAKPQPPAAAMTTEEEQAIRDWLTHIEEDDPEIIDEVVDKCRDNPEARAYFLRRAAEVPRLTPSLSAVTCGACRYFQRNDHPHLGHCAAGEPENPTGLWDMDGRHCTRWRRPT